MINVRAATEKDVGFLVPLVTISSGGVWNAVWKATAKAGEATDDSGARYLADSNHNLSAKNTVIAERDGRGIGAMICYQEMSDKSSNNESLLPPPLIDALQPYRKLTDPNSWFIAELCLLPEARGQGVGTSLLEHAKVEARQRNLPSVTLRVFGSNAGAVRLYERFGFTRQAELPIVPHPDIQVTGSVLLMSCPSNR